MGNFGAAFLLTKEPEWNRLDDLPLGLRGYEFQDRKNQRWLLDAWDPPIRPPEFVFTAGRTVDKRIDFPADDVIRTFDQIVGHIKAKSDWPITYGGGWLRVLLAIAGRLRQNVFFRAADDELYDMAASADGGGVRRIACTMDAYLIGFAEGQWTVTPQSEADEEIYWSEATLAGLRTLHRVHVAEAVQFDGIPFVQSVAASWPDASALSETFPDMGAFSGLGERSALVYEKVGP